MEFDFLLKAGHPGAFIVAGEAENIAQLHAIGWHNEAGLVAKTLWFHELIKPVTVRSLTQKHLFSWFMTYFTLSNRDLIEGSGATEPKAMDTPHSHLLAKWQAKDPEEVANLLRAYSENNLSRALVPSKNVEFGRPDILFAPFDVLAVNMRRKSLGLEWVENGAPRMEDLWPISREEQPLVKDDLIWPLYLQLCEHAGVEPYNQRKLIEVKVDHKTLEIVEW